MHLFQDAEFKLQNFLRHFYVACQHDKMPATWNDLSNEVRKIIIEYVVANKIVIFVPPRVATRSEIKKKEDNNNDEQPQFPFLLVSKRFLTILELNDAVFKTATIQFQQSRDLWAVDTSFARGSIEQIRSLSLSLRSHYQRLPCGLSVKTLSRLERLQKLVYDYRIARVMYSLNVLTMAAKGQLPSSLVKRRDPIYPELFSLQHILMNTQSIFKWFLMLFRVREKKWIAKFLEEAQDRPFERTIQFKMSNYDAEDEYYEEAWFYLICFDAC